jgi:hypothetical protein
MINGLLPLLKQLGGEKYEDIGTTEYDRLGVKGISQAKEDHQKGKM